MGDEWPKPNVLAHIQGLLVRAGEGFETRRGEQQERRGFRTCSLSAVLRILFIFFYQQSQRLQYILRTYLWKIYIVLPCLMRAEKLTSSKVLVGGGNERKISRLVSPCRNTGGDGLGVCQP